MRPAATAAGASGSGGKEGEAGGLLAAALGFAPSVAWGATHWPLIAVTMSMIDSMYDFETEMDIYVDCASKHFWARLLGMIEAVSSDLPAFSFSAMQHG
jgi:hypothetical protein